MEEEKIAIEVPETYEEVFQNSYEELEDIYFENLSKCDKFFPEKENIYHALELTPLDKVRVIIVGQDPYHNISKNTGKCVAQGLAFSVNKGEKIPPSLRNIFDEIRRDIPDYEIPDHGDLSDWARQGVLLLNTSLTVLPGKPESHKDLWIPFISELIKAINEVRPNVIVVLWGDVAKKRISKFLTNKSKKLIAGHPSPFSVKKFMGCKHFSQINKMLIEFGEEPINWQT